MERDASGDSVMDSPDALIGAVEALGSVTEKFHEGPEQQRLDAAHAQGIATARTALDRALALDFAAARESIGDEPDARGDGSAGRAGLQSGLMLAHEPQPTLLPTILDAAERTLQATPDEAPALVFASGELRRSVTADQRTAHGLLATLAEGWMAVVSAPRLLGSEIDRLVAELSYAWSADAARLCFGMRSARGPSEGPSEVPEVSVQLVGDRSVLVQGSDGLRQEQVRVSPGAVLLAPPNCQSIHLPLDADTAHLRVSLPGLIAGDEQAEDRLREAMRPVASGHDPDAARFAVDAVEHGWPMRLRAPGGAHLLTVEAAGWQVAVGGLRVHVCDAGLRLVEALLAGAYVSPESLASELGVDVDRVGAALHELWLAGLLEPAPVPSALQPNERLTQVASAALSPEVIGPFLEAIDPAAWRAPAIGEVHAPDTLQVAVQALDPADVPLASIIPIVAGLNDQFLRIATHIDAVEALLVVRVRPSSDAAVHGELEALGSDLAHGHSTRKLTFVLSLVEANGGWVRLPGGSDTAEATPAALSVWASFRPWMLQPVTSGERLFVLGRVHGPAFV